MDEYAFQGGYYDSQSYGGNQHDGYGDPYPTQPPPPNNYYDAQSQYFCPPQFHAQNSYSQYTPNFQNPYPPQSYQDSLYHFQDPQYASCDQYPHTQQTSPYYTYSSYQPNSPPPPQNPYHQGSSLNHFSPPTQCSPSVRRNGLNEETLALAKRWGVTIVPDGDIEDDGYPMRPIEEEYANNQWEPHEPLYQEPQQECQPFDQDPR
ncbi:PREDICTED: developmental and secondary metabolism regulator VEL1-like [Ipomoea nil]|uniref:developmental and secondary metabolism regulator VEL1-like n=1 Tax=Ipomoea nil TaxID=35883 RepID=UPI000900DBFA|nr:PREDICTED: developmental and secondary metabolism regulator VEL1-like [Ipomoea nil]